MQRCTRWNCLSAERGCRSSVICNVFFLCDAHYCCLHGRSMLQKRPWMYRTSRLCCALRWIVPALLWIAATCIRCVYVQHNCFMKQQTCSNWWSCQVLCRAVHRKSPWTFDIVCRHAFRHCLSTILRVLSVCSFGLRVQSDASCGMQSNSAIFVQLFLDDSGN